MGGATLGLALLALTSSIGSSLAAGAPTSSAFAATGVLDPSDCRNSTYDAALNKVLLAQSNPDCTDVNDCTELARVHLHEYCGSRDGPCPPPSEVDLYQHCATHSLHTFYYTFQEKLLKRKSMMWNIFFLVLSLLLGASFRMCFPKWLPYTVGLLIFGILFGAAAQGLSQSADCPMYALNYDGAVDGVVDGYVSRAEYEMFACVDCDVASYCATAGKLGATHKLLEEQPRSTCGDGTASAVGGSCWWSFDFLDSPWKLSLLHASAVYEFPSNDTHGGGGGHHRRGLASDGSGNEGSGSRLPFPAGDGRLNADELWTTRCNLFIDMISLKDIDPHMMLVVFLPALLFESACFGIDMGIFLKQLPQILIMAFPAMAVASGLTALCIYALAPASWTFWVCWLIGIIASATDPVAVVALLKDLGASKSLGTLIEGESLLNDGSAVVLFVWVRNAIGYDYNTLAPSWMRSGDTGDDLQARYSGQVGIEFLRIVAQMCFLGLLLGVLFGWATKFALKFVYNDRFVEASIIIGMSYFVFWLGELVMGSSAVLAVVVMGLYMNYNKSCISPGVLHFLHEFYEMVAHVLNTVIFLIAGCKLGALMADGSVQAILFEFGYTWNMLLLMYPIVLFARGAAIALAYPLLKRLGTGCTWKDAIVMWWGGLRGSVGLALGLAVHHMMYDKHMWGEVVWQGDPRGSVSYNCRDQPMMVLGLTMVVVTLTVIVNGVTMSPLMKILKMTRTPDERNFMLKAACKHLDHETEEYVKQLKDQGDYSAVDWEFVKEFAVRKEIEIEIEDADKASWLLVLNLERAFYIAQFEHGVLSADAFAMLEGFMANLAADAHFVETQRLGELYDNSFNRVLISKIRGTSFKASLAYEIGLFYLAAQEEVRRLLQTVDDGTNTGADGYNGHDAEQAGRRQSRRASLHGLSLVALEHEDNVIVMREAMQLVEKRKPEAVAHFQTHHATMLVLHKQEKVVKLLLHEGELLDLDAAPLAELIDKRLKRLYVEPLKERIASSRAVMSVTRRRGDPAKPKLGTLHSQHTCKKLGEESTKEVTRGRHAGKKNGPKPTQLISHPSSNALPARPGGSGRSDPSGRSDDADQRCTHGWFAQKHKAVEQLTGGNDFHGPKVGGGGGDGHDITEKSMHVKSPGNPRGAMGGGITSFRPEDGSKHAHYHNSMEA